MLNWFKKKSTGSMTLTEAERILDVVSEALQQDDGLNYHPISSLQGYDVFQVDTALKLRIANDFLILEATDRGGEFEKRAAEWGSIPLHIVTQFVADAELDKLRKLPRGSREYLRTQIMISPLRENGYKDPRFQSLELLSSFGAYCKHVGASDPIYWQKIYSRLDLAYDGGCPKGNEPYWQ